jgi:hypothetical protein
MADSPDLEDSVPESVRSLIATKLCRYVGIMVTIYVLSPGPVLSLYNHGVIKQDSGLAKTLNAIYAPLDYLYNGSALIKGFADWYFGLFP